MARPSLLNVDANPKTVKGQKRGYMTAVLYLAPSNVSGFDVCPMALQAGCREACLNYAGRAAIAKGNALIATDGGMVPDNAIQRARIARTKWFFEDRRAFMAALVLEISRFIRKAKRAGLTPAIRLNGTSDLLWETIPASNNGLTIFDIFPDFQFYDYTKIAKRVDRALPANYHITLSYSEANLRYKNRMQRAHEGGANMAMVVRDRQSKEMVLSANEKAIDGDAHDLRFTDPDGALVVLTAKGRAKKDQSGFVVEVAA